MLRTSKALSEAELVKIMERSARHGSIRAATWLLERQWPERWAAKTAAKGVKADGEQQEPADPFAQLDELAPRRETRAKPS